jgi:hypothetical protein
MPSLIRLYQEITAEDLQILGDLASQDRADFFQRKPRYAVLTHHIIAVALCQGAALHFVDGTNGVKDFDVWSFYSSSAGIQYPPRRLKHRQFPLPKFQNRRVDFLGRTLAASPDTDPIQAIQHYLSDCRSSTAKALSKKAVVLIEPQALLGTVVWPDESVCRTDIR